MQGYGPSNRLAQRLLAILLGCLLSSTPVILSQQRLTGSALALPAAQSSPAPTLQASTPVQVSPSIQPYINRVRQQITQFSLTNGLTFIVLERHEAPVVSFVTYANVGAANEPLGQTGIAHFLEHLAFKGTQRIGSRNYAAEAPILEQLDQVFTNLQTARRDAARPNDRETSSTAAAKVKALTTQFEALKTRAAKLVNQNELGQVIEQSGGVGLNAATSIDSTVYFYSLPANKLELWMSLESERFLQPVFREFYEEKEVILEERRMSLENEPVSELFTAIQAAAFAGQPYEHPVIGYREDIQNLSRRDVANFFATYYGPQNLTIAIVGDVDPAQVKSMAEAYFGGFKAQDAVAIAPKPDRRTQPPKAVAPIVLERDHQPVYIEAYRIPDIRSPDYLISDILSSLLSDGRTSRLYRRLVEGDRTALTAAGFTGYPGDKQTNLMMLYALPVGQDLDVLATAIGAELDRLKTDPVSDAELKRIKTQARASLLRSLSSNEGMAQALAEYAVKTGRWQTLFEELDAIDRITPADLQRVAKQIFRADNRIVGRLVQPKTAPTADPKAAPIAAPK